ncbi:MAG: TIGR04086 family membrane protein [Firmicutes bacterium]|nr:TIGR04086 family membrane protein [Bacillota bacterium]
MKLSKFKLKFGTGPVGAHAEGALYALVMTLGLVLLLSIIVQFGGLSDAVIGPLVQVIKSLAIFTGVYTVLKKIKRRAWMHGGVLGIVYTVLAFFILSIIDQDFSITVGFMAEAIFAFIVGLVSAMLLRIRKRDI